LNTASADIKQSVTVIGFDLLFVSVGVLIFLNCS